jgi:hypothetical protein
MDRFTRGDLPMKRMNSVLVALLLAAIVAVVPAANAQRVHYIGAGSSAMFQGFEVAAVNDLASAPGTGIIKVAPCTNVGVTCTVHHWSLKSSQAPANSFQVQDTRNGAILNEPGNAWVVWVNCSGAGCPAYTGPNGATDVWAYVSVDSVVGTREFLGRSVGGGGGIPGLVIINPAVNTTAGTNIASATANFTPPWNVADDAGVQADVLNQLSNQPLTAAMTDIRPEDALQATNRILGICPAGGCGNAGTPPSANACPPTDTGVPSIAPGAPCNGYPYFYSFTLDYQSAGDARIGNPIQSSFTATSANPVAFALPGFPDPFTGQVVPATIKVIPLGQAPILVLANRSNAAGLGQLQPNTFTIPACNGLGNNTDGAPCVDDAANGGPAINGGSGLGYTGDGSYYVRNVWDQHPFPAIANTFPDLIPHPTLPGDGYCSGAGAGSAFCHITRRPLGNLYAGNLCQGRNTAFSWPRDSALQGARTLIPNGTDFPVLVLLREPLSGTYNTFEYSEIRRFGTPHGNFEQNAAGTTWGKPPYISQESNVAGNAGAPYNPLNNACQPGFGDTDAEGSRRRVIGTGEMVSQVKANPNSIGYAFFSFSNVSSIATSPLYGYLTVDGVDPLFGAYNNAVGNAGQPAVAATPNTWGELPKCTTGGAPNCLANAIWTAEQSYPHLRDGTYPAWSELRLMCDSAQANCLIGADPLGAEALVQNLQADIHFNNLGGVPDLLPMSDAAAGALSFNFPYGDVGFIRDHAADLAAGSTLRTGAVLPNAYDSFILADDTAEFGNFAFPQYINTADPQTTHQSIPQTTFAGYCGAGTNSPPTQECGGDVGGSVIAAPGNVVTNSQGQQQ